MTVSCADCSKCGKCYPKVRPCPTCGATVDFSADAECPTCHSPITQDMIDAAMAEYRAFKKREYEQFFGVKEFHRPKRPANASGGNASGGNASVRPVVQVLKVDEPRL